MGSCRGLKLEKSVPRASSSKWRESEPAWLPCGFSQALITQGLEPCLLMSPPVPANGNWTSIPKVLVSCPDFHCTPQNWQKAQGTSSPVNSTLPQLHLAAFCTGAGSFNFSQVSCSSSWLTSLSQVLVAHTLKNWVLSSGRHLTSIFRVKMNIDISLNTSGTNSDGKSYLYWDLTWSTTSTFWKGCFHNSKE